MAVFVGELNANLLGVSVVLEVACVEGMEVVLVRVEWVDDWFELSLAQLAVLKTKWST